MLAARIPAGFVCGNKVPTIVFEGHSDEALVADAFLAVANSFAFDWILRRMISTSVNYFLLRDLPWPGLEPGRLQTRRLAKLARRLSACQHNEYLGGPRDANTAELRAEIEVIVADAWNIDLDSMRLIFEDFPLLDGASQPIRGEPKSTVTRDLVLLRIAEREGAAKRVREELAHRLDEAMLAGAVAFLPTQFGATMRRSPSLAA
jgi:hypothetical protein